MSRRPSLLLVVRATRLLAMHAVLILTLPSCVSAASRGAPPPMSATCEDLAIFRERFDDDSKSEPCALTDPIPSRH